MHTVTRRSTLAVFITMAFALTMSATAPAASRSASCQGLAGSSRAGQPGAEAAVQFDIKSQSPAPGVLESEFSQNHLGSAEACLA